MQISPSDLECLFRYGALSSAGKVDVSQGASAFAAAMLAAAGTAGAGEAVVEEAGFTLDEYKSAFLEKIDSMTIHPSQAGARQSISIAEELFAKMRADPELEQRVLSEIEEGLGANFAVPPAFCTMRFDENGVYSGTAGGSAYMDAFEKEASDAFWRREPASASVVKSDKDTEKTRREEKREKAKMLEEYLYELAVQRRLDRQAMQTSYRDVVRGEADYVVGPTPVVKPSILESLL